MDSDRREDDIGEHVPRRRDVPHYHGDEVRVLFVIAAVIIVIAQSTGADLPFSAFGAILAVMLLVIAAGITNPAQPFIHWVNAFLAAGGTLLFGTSAFNYYQTGMSIFTVSFTYTEALALLSLVSLYFTTRTIRGIIQRPDLE